MSGSVLRAGCLAAGSPATGLTISNEEDARPHSRVSWGQTDKHSLGASLLQPGAGLPISLGVDGQGGVEERGLGTDNSESSCCLRSDGKVPILREAMLLRCGRYTSEDCDIGMRGVGDSWR